MPHAIIEYSSSLKTQVQPQQLVDSAFEGCAASLLFEPEEIKIRAIAYNAFCVGGLQTDFIHASIRLLSGRTDEQKQQLASSVMNQFALLKLSTVSITIEVNDIHRESYTKQIIK